MATMLYLSNLAPDVTPDKIRDLFTQVGEIVEINLITDHDTGETRGYGFVDMASDAAADAVIRRFHGYAIDNRVLAVSPALRQPRR